MSTPEGELADAVRHSRDRALRQAMAAANAIKVEPEDYTCLAHPTELECRAMRMGHALARRQIYDALERLIASEAPVSVAQPGYTSDGLED